MELSASEVHLWLLQPDEVDLALCAEYTNLLSAVERDQQQRFYFERHRRQYALTRALVRTVLSQYAEVLPGAWRFVKNRYGKPQIAEPGPYSRLRFNLSHTEGMIACAVTTAGEIGVDVESEEKAVQLDSIADSYLSADEAASLADLPGSARLRRLVEYWTLKEAYVKALGKGLSLSLKNCVFEVREERIRLARPPEIGALRARNKDHFWLLPVGACHHAGLALQSNAIMPRPSLRVMKTVPLAGHRLVQLPVAANFYA